MAAQALELQPIRYAEACEFVTRHHRHHKPPQGHLFSIGLNDGKDVVAVVMVGRPIGRHFDDGWTAEVTRCCTDQTLHAASKLYAAAWRACRAMGYRRLITYTLETEVGTSLVAANWRLVGRAGGGSWSCKSRPRVDRHPLGPKCLWEVADAAITTTKGATP